VMAGMNLLVLSQYIAQYERNGPDERFSDAIFPLSAALSETPGQVIYNVDLNIANALRVLHKGRLEVRVRNDLFRSESPDEMARREIHSMISDRNAVFVGRVSMPAHILTEHLEEVAEAQGYHRETLQTIADSNGRPVFAIFHFRPATGAALDR
jgi:hypothetical protein